jgi:HK97 family phage prohead protease
MEKRNKPAFVEPAISRRSANFEFRMVESDTGVRTIKGHGSVFDSPSEDLGGFREIIHKGAFDEAIANSDVRCLINHEANLILGRNTSGTLRLFITDTGLSYECDLPDTTYARDLTVSLDRGDISQSSFAFTMDWEKEGTREDGGNYEYRYNKGDDSWTLHIYKVRELFDVSPVTYPAYKDADVRSAVNGLQAAKQRRDAATQATIDAEQAALDAAKADIEAEDEVFAVEHAERQRQIQINKNKF